MATELDTALDFGAVTRQLDAIERGDMDALRRSFAPGASVWHNTDEVKRNVDQVIGVLAGLCSLSTNRKYDDRRIATVGNTAFVQHTLTAVLPSGRELRMHAMMRVELNPDGLIDCIEEYFDSRAADILEQEITGR